MLSIAAVVFGITALVLSSGFIQWIFLDFRETSIKSQLGHLQITHPGYHEAGKADHNSFLILDNPSDFTQTIDNLEQISGIFPRLSFSGLISHNESSLSFIGEGVDPLEQNIFGESLQISEGKYLLATLPKHIVVGEGLARNLGINVGDQVTLLVNTASGGINAIEVVISGLFTTVTKSYDDSALRIPIETARMLLRTEGSHSWIVLLKDTEQTNNVMTVLRNKLPQDKFEITPWYKLADFYNKTVALFTKQVMGIKVIIAAIILLSIFNTMSISVIERIGEIGTALALGAKRIDIMKLFLAEGILIGSIGGIIGLIIGLILANIISNIGIEMPPPPGMGRGYTGQILITFHMALEALILAIATTLFASIFPAWKASRLQIVDALRRNR
nr:FtsX-like permease family protein [Nitrosomonas nitrosa]